MSMEIFIRQLNFLAKEQPETYGRAVQNVVSDFRCDTNHHGNITEVAQQSIARCCAPSHDTDIDHLMRVINNHLSFKQASGCQRRETPDEPLRTVVPYDCYVTWHLGTSDAQGDGSFETVLHIGHLSAPVSERIPIAFFCGGTNEASRATWWSFGANVPVNGRDYVAALALPKATADIAERCGGIAEIQIPAEAMSESLYKPSSLDGFGPGSKFKPDHTTSFCGWTDPDPIPNDPQRQRRPELVSRSFRYDQIKDRTLCLTVKLYPF